jgi:DNA polymerase-3 subunit epsilon
MAWYEDLLVGFDLETTGTDPHEARIVTAAVTEVKAGEPVRHREWLADPGVPIPAETTAIHGVSTERAAAEGRPAPEVVAEIADALRAYWALGVPVVVYNAPFYPRTPGTSQVSHGEARRRPAAHAGMRAA